MVEDPQKTMTFVCQDLGNTIFQKLYEQKKASRFCDLTLYVNNKIIKAHRNVLACSSPYFDSILKHHKAMQEQLTINCLDSNIFNNLLTYMYTGKITIEHSTVQELLRLADHFIITKVMEYCVEFLGTKLQVDNCIFTYDLTRKFKMKGLGDLVQNWISSHLHEILEGKEILELDEYELKDFLKQNFMNITPMTALNVITKWTYQDPGIREKFFNKLLSSINWINIDKNEIFKHTETNMLYAKSELCLYVLLNYLLKYELLLSNYHQKYEELHVKYAQNLAFDDAKKDAKPTDSSKISVTENPVESGDNCNIKMLVIKAKQKSKNQQLLRRLMLYSLKPSLRMAALKTLMCKKKKISIVNVEKKKKKPIAGNRTAAEGNGEEQPKSGTGTVKCPVCFIAVNDALLLEHHLALAHSKDVTYKCSVCAFVCQYQNDYMSHMKTHFSGPPFKCDYCDLSTDHIAKLVAHRAKHLEDSMYQCNFCSFKCRIKQNLTAHLKVHAHSNSVSNGNGPNGSSGALLSSSTEKTYKCDSCNKTFRFKNSLDSHRISHHNGQDSGKQLTCDLCGFNTKFLSHMIAHKRIHSAKKSQLTNRTHNGVRPHSCSICGRGFMEKSHLVRHERIHLEEKPFKCSNCDYASSRRDKLKEHFTRHHGENASAKVPYKARPLRNGGSNGGAVNAATVTVVSGTSGNGSRPKNQNQENNGHSTSANSGAISSFPGSNAGDTGSGSGSGNIAPQTSTIGNEIQELLMHHQNHAAAAGQNLTSINHNYHHFAAATAADPNDFHHHAVAAAAVAHNQRISGGGGSVAGSQHQQVATSGNSSAANSNAVAAAAAVNHHMLTAARVNNHSAATSTAAAVAAAMMLDPRFHHNTGVPYHTNATPVSMAMAAVQQSQQHLQASNQHGEYATSLQNCMTLF